MVKKISVGELAEIILEDGKELLSPLEIWIKAQKSERKEIKEKVKIMKKGQSPVYSIAARIYDDLKKPNSVFHQPFKGIRKFCLAKYK